MTNKKQLNPHIDILLAEDNPGDVILMQEAFHDTGLLHTLHSVPDGEQALDFLYKRGPFAMAATPHFVMLDLNMPKHNGYHVLETIKSDPALKHIPVAVISSSKAPSDIKRCYSLHANSYISKPQSLDDLSYLAEAITRFWFHCVLLPA